MSYADLSEANLSSADLSGADLQASKVLHTNFQRAILTGACIEDWQIGSGTKFEGVECDYIYRTWELEKFTDRLPIDPFSTLAPGEFERWIAVRQGALDTIDITFTDGIDWQAFFQSLQVTRQQHPEANVVMKSVEEEGGVFVTRLKVETEVTGESLEALKANIETQVKSTYELKLAEARGANMALERSLDNALGKLAMTSKNTSYTFNAPVGNVADVNQGEMTTYINQNNEAIASLIDSLRATAQSFPLEQQEATLMDLDDLESDLKTPEKRDPKRIGIKLKRLIAAGTVVATVATGAATFSGNVNEFIENVYAIGEQVGIGRGELGGKE